MPGVFDYVTSINKNKKNLMRDSEDDAQAEKDYNAYITNMALSYFPDTILHANVMNLNAHLNNRAQYEFLLNSVRSANRFKKWVKETSDDDIELIMSTYKCNKTLAKTYLKVLSKAQLEIMKQEQETGGNANDRRASRNSANK